MIGMDGVQRRETGRPSNYDQTANRAQRDAHSSFDIPPKGIGLKSHMRPVAMAIKIVIDHVIRRPDALSDA
jgi:hypothetical protein